MISFRLWICLSYDKKSNKMRPSRQLTYIEVYTKSIQAVESMLKLDRLRQEVAITNMLSKWVIFQCLHGLTSQRETSYLVYHYRKERQARMQHFGLPSGSFRMKRAVSLPNTIANSVRSLANIHGLLVRVGAHQLWFTMIFVAAPLRSPSHSEPSSGWRWSPFTGVVNDK